MKKLSDIKPNRSLKADNYEARCNLSNGLLPILEGLQENLPFFRQKAKTTSLMMTAKEWSTPLLKSGYTLNDCNCAYALIILLGLKDIQLADLIRVISIQKRYRKEDINEARKIVLEYFSNNPIAELSEIVKPIAQRNAIDREQQQRKQLAIGLSPATKESAKSFLSQIKSQVA